MPVSDTEVMGHLLPSARLAVEQICEMVEATIRGSSTETPDQRVCGQAGSPERRRVFAHEAVAVERPGRLVQPVRGVREQPMAREPVLLVAHVPYQVGQLVENRPAQDLVVVDLEDPRAGAECIEPRGAHVRSVARTRTGSPDRRSGHGDPSASRPHVESTARTISSAASRSWPSTAATRGPASAVRQQTDRFTMPGIDRSRSRRSIPRGGSTPGNTMPPASPPLCGRHGVVRASPTVDSRFVLACTIVARNYLAHARVLAASFLEHHPDGHARRPPPR